jgi:DNA-binding GntR family transcriptional regulator
MKAIGAGANLTAKAVEALHSSIVSGELAPGSLYSVTTLAEQLSVSRTPVREALIKLAEQGMVRFENRGIRVLQTSAHDIEEVFSLRLLLEVPATVRSTQLFTTVDRCNLRAAYAAMLRAAESGDEQEMMGHDRRFHAILLEGSGNLRLSRFVDGLRDMVLLRGISTSSHRSLPEIAKEHEPILRHVEARSAREAAEAMRTHLLRTATVLITQESGSSDTVAQSFEWTHPPQF